MFELLIFLVFAYGLPIWMLYMWNGEKDQIMSLYLGILITAIVFNTAYGLVTGEQFMITLP